MTTPTFRSLRLAAAEAEAERLREDGRDVVVVEHPDPMAPSPAQCIPAIYDRSELERHRDELAAAPARGISPHDVAPPVPILDYAAWTFHPTCPGCAGRLMHVEGVGDVGAMDSRDWPVIERVMRATGAARCLRPMVDRLAREGERRRRRDCGWTGTAADLCWPCFRCRQRRAGAASGVCGECRPVQVEAPGAVGESVPAPGGGGSGKKRRRRRQR